MFVETTKSFRSLREEARAFSKNACMHEYACEPCRRAGGDQKRHTALTEYEHILGHS